MGVDDGVLAGDSGGTGGAGDGGLQNELAGRQPTGAADLRATRAVGDMGGTAAADCAAVAGGAAGEGSGADDAGGGDSVDGRVVLPGSAATRAGPTDEGEARTAAAGWWMRGDGPPLQSGVVVVGEDAGEVAGAVL